jgi:hypothetical protein
MIERGLLFDHGLDTPSCEEAMAWQIREDPDESPGRIDAQEREDIAIEPDMDPKTQTADFIDEFGNGVVLQRVNGRWLFAGIATR